MRLRCIHVAPSVDPRRKQIIWRLRLPVRQHFGRRIAAAYADAYEWILGAGSLVCNDLLWPKLISPRHGQWDAAPRPYAPSFEFWPLGKVEFTPPLIAVNTLTVTTVFTMLLHLMANDLSVYTCHKCIGIGIGMGKWLRHSLTPCHYRHLRPVEVGPRKAIG